MSEAIAEALAEDECRTEMSLSDAATKLNGDGLPVAPAGKTERRTGRVWNLPRAIIQIKNSEKQELIVYRFNFKASSSTSSKASFSKRPRSQEQLLRVAKVIIHERSPHSEHHKEGSSVRQELKRIITHN